ncbi:MAG: four helix bundle protein [Candidatus Omnitrophica bacterium]|nr:four helix bundle protein [Candidatus Omnitrophota bacterium]MCM8816602.1 four helix bundle protein [Candidatus Omnitrophota bacterium]
MKTYRDLIIWQKGLVLAKEIYSLSRKLPGIERYSLINQMQRAAVSIPANIAEGQARRHKKEFKQYLSIALGSLAELDTYLTLSVLLGYLTDSEIKSIREQIVELQKMICGFASNLVVSNY